MEVFEFLSRADILDCPVKLIIIRNDVVIQLVLFINLLCKIYLEALRNRHWHVSVSIHTKDYVTFISDIIEAHF
jgi:hypothetical protein